MKALEKRYILQDYKFVSILGTKSEQQSWQQVQTGPAGMREKGAVSLLKAAFALCNFGRSDVVGGQWEEWFGFY